MGPIDFLKTCFAIACVLMFGVIYIKVSFAFIDWLVEQIRKTILKRRIKRKLIELIQQPSKEQRCRENEQETNT